jgi:ArsR family metal-binding transcriptional regulator
LLLKSYSLEIVNNHCLPGAMSVNAIARLDADVGCAVPYLNAVLGGSEYLKEPPAVTFRLQGKLISVQGRAITVNALKDEAEARKIVEWIRREINDAWESRDKIEPCYEGAGRPNLIEVLKLLPRTNCRRCGQPTCMVFAARLAEGAKGAGDCPELEEEPKVKLDQYLAQFELEV